MTGPSVFAAHVEGARHQKNLVKAEAGAPIKRPKGARKEGPQPRIQQVIDDYADQPLIGLQYVTEYTKNNPNIEARYMCSLCDCRSDPRTLIAHVICLKHRVNYMKECFMNYFTLLRMNQPKRTDQPEIVQNYAQQIEDEEGRKPIKTQLGIDPFYNPNQDPEMKNAQRILQGVKARDKDAKGRRKSMSPPSRNPDGRRRSPEGSRRDRSRRASSPDPYANVPHRGRDRGRALGGRPYDRHDRFARDSPPRRAHRRQNQEPYDSFPRERDPYADRDRYPPKGHHSYPKRGPRDSYAPENDPYARDNNPYSPSRAPQRPPVRGEPKPRPADPYSRENDPYAPRNDPYAPSNDPYSEHKRDPYAARNDPYAPRRDPYAARHDPYARDSDPYAPKNDPYAPKNDPYAPKNDPYAPKNDPYAPKNDPYAPKNDPYAPKGQQPPPGSSKKPSPAKKSLVPYGEEDAAEDEVDESVYDVTAAPAQKNLHGLVESEEAAAMAMKVSSKLAGALINYRQKSNQ